MKEKFVDLKKRFLFGFLGLVVVGVFIFFSEREAFKPLFAFFVAALGVFAILEYLKISQKKGVLLNKKILVAAVFLEIFAFFIFTRKKLFVKDALPQGVFEILPFFLIFLVFLILFFSHMKKIEGFFSYFSHSLLGFLYIAIPLGLIFPILYGEDGRLWIIYLIVVTKSVDIGGYFGGRLLGKKPFFENISPKKTTSGALFGFILAVLISFLFFRTVESIVIGAFLGVIGQAGDLFESMLKREAKVKDSSNLPGLGGVLDTMDSLLFNIPFLYIYLEVFRR
jgi:phosphatidate cytidylyltransferase